MQRVHEASVTVAGKKVAAIGKGLLVFAGLSFEDTADQIGYLVHKTAGLRVFEDEAGKMNLSVEETGGEVLVVSQFTLYGDCRKGRRPSFTDAAPPQKALPLFESLVKTFEHVLPGRVQHGIFGAHMDISLVNDGPATFLLEQ